MPMPRLTSMPSRNSCAIRLAMMVDASIGVPSVRDEVIDQRRRRHDVIGRDHTGGHDVLGVHDHGVRGHGDHWVEVARGERVLEIAEIVSSERADECEVRAQRSFHEVRLAVEYDGGFALLDHGADAGRGQYTAESEATGADPLDERALRDELHVRLAGDHLLLRLGIEADVTHDRAPHEPRSDELADADAG